MAAGKEEGMTWDGLADSWDSEATRNYAKQAFGSLREVIDIAQLRVLDFGCGTGLLSELMSPNVNEIVAVDCSGPMIEQLKKKKIPNLKAISGYMTIDTIQKEEALGEPFDLIVASSVCAFVPEYENQLGILKTLLKEGGTFIQWDWLVEKEGGHGLTRNQMEKGMSSNFQDYSIKTGFIFEHEGHKAEVLMGMAVNR